MQQRVACQGQPGHPCGAHRDLALSARCLVCGCIASRPVPPTVGDCYVALSKWASDLFALHPSPDNLAIIQALSKASLRYDAAATRQRR